MLVRPALAFAITYLLTPLVIRALGRWNVLDVPNERSSHRQATPRGGGLAVAVGVVAAAVVSPDLDGNVRSALIAGGSAFAVIGLLEDIVGIPALRRLPLLFVAAAASTPWLLAGMSGGPAWRVAFAALVVTWIVGYANAFNFMDGINGIGGAQVVVAGVAWFVVGRAEDVDWLAAAGLILAAAALGFLPFNFPRARVFLGDVGSYFLGGALAILAVAAVRQGVPPEAVFAPLAIFLADTATTLVRRVARGDRWYTPHREHAYQRLTTVFGDSHVRTTAAVTAAMTVAAALGGLSLIDVAAVRLLADLALAGLLLAYLAAPSRLAAVGGRISLVS